jgi:hypothetical protein
MPEVQTLMCKPGVGLAIWMVPSPVAVPSRAEVEQPVKRENQDMSDSHKAHKATRTWKDELTCFNMHCGDWTG